MKIAIVLAALAATIGGAPATAAEPVQVMVLGTYHFGNPGLDLNNMKAEDVTTPQRQAELAALAAALAEYWPTKIMVESLAKGPELIDVRYAAFAPAALATDRNETVQIGYRLANRLGHSKVYAIDEQPGEGEPDYFPFDKVASFAETHGQMERLDAIMAYGAAATKEMEAKQKTHSVAGLLADINSPEKETADIGPYYQLLSVGDAAQQPGADLNAMWYLRNAKIFAKLMAVAAPGDRLLVVYGSGHNYWLRHFARATPGYVSVDPSPYLRKAAGR